MASALGRHPVAMIVICQRTDRATPVGRQSYRRKRERRCHEESAGQSDESNPIIPFWEVGSLPLPHRCFCRTLKPMEVQFNPDVQAKLDELATETGRPTDELVKDAVLGYFNELAQTREMLNSRYDDLKSGRVKPISGDEVIARLREKSAARRSPRAS
jgi:predicted DNA-binding protein